MLDLAQIPCTMREVTLHERAGKIASVSLTIELPADSPYQRRLWDAGFFGWNEEPEAIHYCGIKMSVVSATGNGLGSVSGRPMTFNLQGRLRDIPHETTWFSIALTVPVRTRPPRWLVPLHVDLIAANPLMIIERPDLEPKEGQILVYDEELGECRPVTLPELPPPEPPLAAMSTRAADDFEVIRARQAELAEERAPKDFLRYVHPETGTVYLKPVSDRAEVSARCHPDKQLVSDTEWYAFTTGGCPWDGSGEISIQDVDRGPNL